MGGKGSRWCVVVGGAGLAEVETPRSKCRSETVSLGHLPFLPRGTRDTCALFRPQN